MIIRASETVLTIILMIGLGYLISHLGWYKKEDKDFLSKLIINISVPAVIIKTFFVSFPRDLLISSGSMIFPVFIAVILPYFLAILISRLLNYSQDMKIAFSSLSTLSNAMFIGLAVNISMFGDASIPYVMIYYLVSNSLLWIYFAPMFKEEEEVDSIGGKIKSRFKSLLSIPLITLFLSIGLSLMGLKLPSIALDLVDYLGAMSTPLSLIFIGGVIYEVGSLRMEPSMFLVILIRFVFSPVLMFIIAKKAGFNDLAIQALTIQAGMPPMTQLGVIAGGGHNEEEDYIMTSIASLTLISLIFIPIYIIIMPKFL